MSFEFRVAPGVQVTASPSGVQTTLPLGAADGHGVGDRASGVGRHHGRVTSTSRVNRQLAASARARAHPHKEAEAQRLAQVFDAVFALNRGDFVTAQRSYAPPPPAPPEARLRAIYRADARRSTGAFPRAARKQALADAEQRANVAVAQAHAELARQAEQRQKQLEVEWSLLESCDPATVLFALARAFEDNDAAASPVGVVDREVCLVVIVPPASDLPLRMPSTTRAGNLSLKKLSKTEAADIYKQLVFGHLLLTLREAFAVAPGLHSGRVVAVRASVVDAYGRGEPEIVAALRCTRDALVGVAWDQVDAVRVANDCCTDKLVLQKGVTRALQPLPLTEEPDLHALLEHIVLSG